MELLVPLIPPSFPVVSSLISVQTTHPGTATPTHTPVAVHSTPGRTPQRPQTPVAIPAFSTPSTSARQKIYANWQPPPTPSHVSELLFVLVLPWFHVPCVYLTCISLCTES